MIEQLCEFVLTTLDFLAHEPLAIIAICCYTVAVAWKFASYLISVR